MYRIVFGLVLALSVAMPVGACPPVRRSAAVLRAFQRLHPCPSTGRKTGTCPGYVKDHKEPLCLVGKAGDVVENLQWQTVADAKLKDKIESQLCAQPHVCPRRGD